MNIVDPILFQCRVSGEQPAICAPGTTLELVSYAQLEHMIHNLTRAVFSLRLERGQIVGILVNDKIFHIALILALTRIGIATVSCRSPSLPKELNAAAIITDTPGQPVSGVDRIVVATADWIKGEGTPVVDPRLHQTHPDDLCRIILTSGSTGIPKAIAFTHSKLITKNARLDYCQGDRWPRSSRLFCDLGLSSSQGFRYVIHMLTRGGMVLVYGEGFSTLQYLNLFDIQNMATSPFGLVEYLKFFESEPAFHCNFDHILVAGGMLTKSFAERAWARMCPNLISLYGATEVGAIATADARLTTPIAGAVGYVLPDAQAQIIDQSGKLLPLGIEGIVRVRTDQAITGYYGDPEGSAAMFRDGWFYPGDFGYLADGGLLVITGRLETRLNVGGDKVNPEAVETVLVAFPGVSDAAVLTVPNALGIEEIYALIKGQRPFDDGALRAHCQARLERPFVPVRFISVGEIPRNEMGKIERGRLLEVAKSQLR